MAEEKSTKKSVKKSNKKSSRTAGHKPNGDFAKGNVANPKGRPKGAVSGRKKALAALDDICGSEKNIKKLRKAMQTSFDNKPLAFFEKIIMRLLPQETKLEHTGKDGGDLTIKIMSGNAHKQAREDAQNAGNTDTD